MGRGHFNERLEIKDKNFFAEKVEFFILEKKFYVGPEKDIFEFVATIDRKRNEQVSVPEMEQVKARPQRPGPKFQTCTKDAGFEVF